MSNENQNPLSARGKIKAVLSSRRKQFLDAKIGLIVATFEGADGFGAVVGVEYRPIDLAMSDLEKSQLADRVPVDSRADLFALFGEVLEEIRESDRSEYKLFEIAANGTIFYDATRNELLYSVVRTSITKFGPVTL